MSRRRCCASRPKICHSLKTRRTAVAYKFLSLCLATCAGIYSFPPLALGDAPAGVKHIYKTVGETELSIYVSQPAEQPGSKPDALRPAIVFFHGGGWTGGAPGQFTEHAKYFASRGLVCFQVQYRLLDKKSKDPPITCTEDAVSAMRWVRVHCEEFSVDPNRIASAGGSAGGHLAAFVGCVDVPQTDQEPSPKSNAMLLFNPVYDNGPGGWGTARVGDRFQEFSPLHNLTKDDPPSSSFIKPSRLTFIKAKPPRSFQLPTARLRSEVPRSSSGRTPPPQQHGQRA